MGRQRKVRVVLNMYDANKGEAESPTWRKAYIQVELATVVGICPRYGHLNRYHMYII